MATVYLTDDIRIRGFDSRNLVVELRKVTSADGPSAHLVKYPGRVKWETMGYHGKLELAVRQALELHIKIVPGEFHPQDLVRHLDELVGRLVKALQELQTEAA